MREAMYYTTMKNQQLQCQLCPHYCVLKQGHTGRCLVRKNIEGKLYSLNYGKLSAIAIDPIEKKPLHHFFPGSEILSVGSYGCNMKCEFCQNCDISREFNIPKQYIKPEDIVNSAMDHDLKSIAYTYNEPTVFYEWMIETAKCAKEHGIRNVMVTNGFINPEPFMQLAPLLDAMNIDIKTYDDKQYQRICAGRLAPVLKTIALAKGYGIHVELTCLIVPKLNDDIEQLDKLFEQIHQRVGDIELHVSRYFPRYHYNEPATDIALMLKIKEVAKKYFSYVSLGNVR